MPPSLNEDREITSKLCMYVDRTLINLNNYVKRPNCTKGEKMNIRIVMMYLVASDEKSCYGAI